MTSVLGSLRRAREWAYPQLTESAFLEKGVLTPEEFVLAGDELVFRCPTWEWSSAPKASKQKAYLPPDKQYLITRNVPCRNRVSSLETNLKMDGLEEDGHGCGEDWMISSILAEGERADGEEDDNIEDDFDILDEDGEVVEKTPDEPKPGAPSTGAAAPGGGGDDDDDNNDDEYGDIDDYEDDDILVDEDAAAVPSANPGADGGGTAEGSSAIVKTRTYDLSITYDKYYQVPRVWMVGRDEDDQPLTSRQMMEDVISDYANKTVTMETHPHVSSSCPHASIHPCQHAKVMKAIVKNLIKGSDRSGSSDPETPDGDDKPLGPAVETYLFIFLKFVSSMIPTINYDFTMEVTADTSK